MLTMVSNITSVQVTTARIGTDLYLLDRVLKVQPVSINGLVNLKGAENYPSTDETSIALACPCGVTLTFTKQLPGECFSGSAARIGDSGSGVS